MSSTLPERQASSSHISDRTILIMISIGKRERLTDFSVPRLRNFASKHGYSIGLITENIQPDGLPPHYAKLCAHKLFPGFGRYCIIDDDILLSANAPALPCVPDGYIGLVKDAVQDNTTEIFVDWTGNTGFLVFNASATYLLDMAVEHGDHASIWGYADQGALNYVLWQEKKAYELDSRWNYAPVIVYFHQNKEIGWDRWRMNRRLRLYYFASLALNPRSETRRRIRENWGIHLIRAPYTKLFDRNVPNW